MNLTSLSGLPMLSAVAMCCVGAASPALAAPPQTRLVQNVRPAVEFSRITDKTSNSSLIPTLSAGQQVTPRPHLDLRPPAAGEFGMLSVAGSAPGNGNELGMPRHAVEHEYAGEDDSYSRGLSTLRDAGPQAHPKGLAQGIADRFHREGLPVARLWENHAALVSLGFNPKGKPGLWLVQKTH